MAHRPIIVYMKQSCPYSRALRRKLQHDGLTFQEFDVLKDKDVYDEMMALNGHKSETPTWIQDGRVIVGFHGS